MDFNLHFSFLVLFYFLHCFVLASRLMSVENGNHQRSVVTKKRHIIIFRSRNMERRLIFEVEASRIMNFTRTRFSFCNVSHDNCVKVSLVFPLPANIDIDSSSIFRHLALDWHVMKITLYNDTCFLLSSSSFVIYFFRRVLLVVKVVFHVTIIA